MITLGFARTSAALRRMAAAMAAFSNTSQYLLLATAIAFAPLPALAQQAVPTIAFDSVPNPLKLPTNMYFGEVSGVSVNSKGHVFALSRGNTSGPAYAAAATQLLEFDAQGKFVREIGKNLYAWSFGHTVKIDPNNNNNILVRHRGDRRKLRASGHRPLPFGPGGDRFLGGVVRAVSHARPGAGKVSG